jgi:hypothetical protein
VGDVVFIRDDYVLYICSSMDLFINILINLLSNALWSIGRFLILKKSLVSHHVTSFFKKITSVNCYLPFTFKKILFGCRMTTAFSLKKSDVVRLINLTAIPILKKSF